VGCILISAAGIHHFKMFSGRILSRLSEIFEFIFKGETIGDNDANISL
jgi:hypothetical protein